MIIKFSARDIFVSPGGQESFQIEGDKIKLKDWEGYEYILDANGREIENSSVLHDAPYKTL